MEQAQPKITAAVVPEERSKDIMSKFFNHRYMVVAETFVYRAMEEIGKGYSGGFLKFVELSNGGFYMAPESSRSFRVSIGKTDYETFTTDAAAITACLLAFNRLAVATAQAHVLDLYNKLHAFTLQHDQADSIIRAVQSRGKELFPSAVCEEIRSVQMPDIVGDYDTPDQVPEWAWVESKACYQHTLNGQLGIWEFVINMNGDLSDVPERLAATINAAAFDGMAYLIFHQGNKEAPL